MRSGTRANISKYSMDKKYDVVVIGAGSGGLTAAVGFARAGKKVALIERDQLGGECTNSGCIPSKALLHAAKQYHQAHIVMGNTAQGDAYRAGALTYVRTTINTVRAGETPATFAAMGIDVVFGAARFTSLTTVAVARVTYHFKTAIIATGSGPRLIDIAGLNSADIFTNQNIFQTTTLPEKLLILGAGPIGLELGQAFAMLGSAVTLATLEPELAWREDMALRPIIQQAFTDLHITLLTQATMARVENNEAIFTLKNGDATIGETRVPFDKILIAIGRTPNLPLGLDKAGVFTTESGITVDSQYQTNNKNVYAVGDVVQHFKFTHTADDIARQVVTRVVSKGLLRVSNQKAIPKVTYTEPEIAQVGITWDVALTRYGEAALRRIEIPFSKNDRAVTDDATTGVLVVIARRLTGSILGAHIAGPRAGELITIFTLAIDEKISLWKLQRLIFAYPTYSLIIKKAADQFVSQQFSELVTDLLYVLKRQTPKLLAALLWLAIILSLYIYQTSHSLTTAQTAIALFNTITLTIWGPLLYVLAYTIRPITFFPATVLTILSGIFFGFVWGFVLTVIAATLAAGIAYGVGRFFGSDLKLETTRLGNWITALRHNTFAAVLTMRLLFLPFDLVSYAAGIIRTTFVPFIAATVLGSLLGTATFVAIGASINLTEFESNGFSTALFDYTYLTFALIILIVSIAVSRVIKHRRTRPRF